MTCWTFEGWSSNSLLIWGLKLMVWGKSLDASQMLVLQMCRTMSSIFIFFKFRKRCSCWDWVESWEWVCTTVCDRITVRFIFDFCYIYIFNSITGNAIIFKCACVCVCVCLCVCACPPVCIEKQGKHNRGLLVATFHSLSQSECWK